MSAVRAVVPAAGMAVAVTLARLAARDTVRRRLRATRPRPRRELPRAVREPLGRALADANVEIGPEEACGIALTGVAVVALFAAALSPALALPAALAAALAAPVALAVARGRGHRRFLAALPEFVDLVAARLRSGHTVPTALADATERRDPVAGDVRRVLRRVEHGEAVPAALAWWAEDRRSDEVRAVAGALAVAATTGGAAADALEGIARSLRDQLGARAEALSLSAQARMSAVVVGAAPVAYLVFSAAVDPHAARALVDTALGRICLVLGIGLDALAALWMRRIVRSEP